MAPQWAKTYTQSNRHAVALAPELFSQTNG